ncbi:dolichol-phosphate mannosyltransferase [Ruaniaceae bacterium KH17]|nr:dolichol-phosphate mannosyltransferase [Ruaniaceae bacterium KH17]
MKPLVIVPTYNEIENIDRVVAELTGLGVELLIVDDASPDGTGIRADEHAAAHETVHVLHRRGKEGLGPAYIAGFRWGLEHDYTHLIEMDADGSHRIEDLPKLIARAGEDDAPGLVIGSRWVKDGEVENWPIHREILSRGANIYVRAALGLHVGDATAGFRVYRREVLEAIDLSGLDARGYFFQIEMTWRAAEAGAAIVEVPITFVERREGVSKMGGSIISEAFLGTAKLAWNSRFKR